MTEPSPRTSELHGCEIQSRSGLTENTRVDSAPIQAVAPAPTGPFPLSEAQRTARNERLHLVQSAQLLVAQGRGLRSAARVLGVSYSALHRYVKAYKQGGVDALVPQFDRRGRRKKFELTEDQERRIRELNLRSDSAMLALKLFAEDPLCPPEWAEEIRHGRISPSLRKAAYLTRDIKNRYRGPKTYGLGGYTSMRGTTEVLADGTEREVQPGDWWELDDMSFNQPFWYENPFAHDRLAQRQGVGIGRQSLIAMDVASGKWLGCELIGRPRDAYRAEDILRFFRKLFGQWGLPRRGLRLERGIWRSRRIAGQQIGPLAEDEQKRLWGGLAELGLEVKFAWSPHQKGAIEVGFDHLQSAMAVTQAANIGRKRGEFERATKNLIAAHAGSAHPRDRGFAHINHLADLAQSAMTWLNTHAKEGRIQRGVPDDRWEASVERHGPLAPLPTEKLWIFLPESRQLQVRAGHVAPQVQGVGPLPFTDPELFARLGAGYRLIVAFDPSEPTIGAAVFNAEPQDAARNRLGWRVGQYIGHVEFAGFAPQFCAAENFDPQSKERRRRYHNFNTSAFRAIGVHGRPAAGVQEARDGRGNVARLGNDAAQSLQAPISRRAKERQRDIELAMGEPDDFTALASDEKRPRRRQRQDWAVSLDEMNEL